MKTLTITVAIASLATSALGQVIYSPNIALPDQKINLKPWGSGTIAEADELAFSGTTSIRVSSRNFFQGGSIIFGAPVNLAAPTADKSNMFLVTLQPSKATTTFGSGNAGPGLGGSGEGTAGSGSSAGSTQRSVSLDATLKQVRCVITTTDGKKSEVYIDLTSALPNARGWMSVGVPLVSIPGFEKSNKIVKEIAFSGDTIGTFYVGELRVLNDTSPLYVEPTIREANLALGDEISIAAIGSGGATQLTYSWDFDAKDGVDTDATGMHVKRRFNKAGVYTITLTVKDKFGLKQPYSTTLKITVNP
jgi:hypothetical protein